jgi:hypothetical protein
MQRLRLLWRWLRDIFASHPRAWSATKVAADVRYGMDVRFGRQGEQP